VVPNSCSTGTIGDPTTYSCGPGIGDECCLPTAACAGQPCSGDGGCCPGAYCWGFSNTCEQDGTCQGAPSGPGLCSCDGYLVGSCPAGQYCPTPAHGHDTYCTDLADGGDGGGCTGITPGTCAAGEMCCNLSGITVDYGCITATDAGCPALE
jgi:hypothetical protein